MTCCACCPPPAPAAVGFGELPFIARLLLANTTNNPYVLCTGSLIAPTVLLTAGEHSRGWRAAGAPRAPPAMGHAVLVAYTRCKSCSIGERSGSTLLTFPHSSSPPAGGQRRSQCQCLQRPPAALMSLLCCSPLPRERGDSRPLQPPALPVLLPQQDDGGADQQVLPRECPGPALGEGGWRHRRGRQVCRRSHCSSHWPCSEEWPADWARWCSGSAMRPPA